MTLHHNFKPMTNTELLTKNQSIVIDGNDAFFGGTKSTQIRDFSELSDTVTLSTVMPSNLHTRMHSGNDIVTLSNKADAHHTKIISTALFLSNGRESSNRDGRSQQPQGETTQH